MILVMCCIIYTECDFSNDLNFIYEIFILTVAVGNASHIDSMLYMSVDDLSIFLKCQEPFSLAGENVTQVIFNDFIRIYMPGN